MIDIKLIRKNPEIVIEALKKRHHETDLINQIIELDESKRHIQKKVEILRAQRNSLSKQIAKLKASGDTEELKDIMIESKEIGDEIKKLEVDMREIEDKIHIKLLYIPNIPDDSVPVGKSEEDNIEIKRWENPRNFDFKPKAHWDLGPQLGMLDFERASKLSGSRFSILKSQLAKLERSLINFMLDVHTKEHGYIEIIPPHLVKRETMLGTGQLPKFEEDAYNTKDDDLFLIPTAEVTLAGMHQNEVLSFKDLPLKYVAYTPCYRREAGSYGKDVRGMVRQHQFDKVELFWYTTPDNSESALEELTSHAEKILQLLKLPYRVITLCTGDLGFGASKTYDLEVWLPSYNNYKEISSCSNVKDFQARRGNTRYRTRENKMAYVHTLNGSGLAVGRTLVAIMENYQLKDGKIKVPDVLIPYMGVEVIG
ncbi:seryl-tRNA synthetase [Marinitoga hydrogenitolerans DSM 16785]|uniref:Serine--tRNA ligase n=1 Tax=Marinitoga hydrogenitolerans (strain DSM 16785 / JCM 12826 / AT1271) TaxID=1122195 RepID=A0A1M4WA34_MARH1|nr:serine--tRNA ligase [Marinitoga hydrogenitolerans]SHE78020.1 seryl-tRNA synthetase [Marinitoga hydrogenitolerans DSM 16785]